MKLYTYFGARVLFQSHGYTCTILYALHSIHDKRLFHSNITKKKNVALESLTFLWTLTAFEQKKAHNLNSCKKAIMSIWITVKSHVKKRRSFFFSSKFQALNSYNLAINISILKISSHHQLRHLNTCCMTNTSIITHYNLCYWKSRGFEM